MKILRFKGCWNKMSTTGDTSISVKVKIIFPIYQILRRLILLETPCLKFMLVLKILYDIIYIIKNKTHI